MNENFLISSIKAMNDHKSSLRNEKEKSDKKAKKEITIETNEKEKKTKSDEQQKPNVNKSKSKEETDKNDKIRLLSVAYLADTISNSQLTSNYGEISDFTFLTI